MTNKILKTLYSRLAFAIDKQTNFVKVKTLGTLVLGAGLSFNSYGQDTLRSAEGYIVRDDKGNFIQDVRIGKDWKDIYEYKDGKLTNLTTFSGGIKTQLYLYNEKGQLIKETIFNKEGKIKEVIEHKL